MGKTLRQIRKGKRKSIKNRKSVRKGKKSVKMRKSYKKMRGGGKLENELDAFVKEATSSIEKDLSKEDIDLIIERLNLNELKDMKVNDLKNNLESRKFTWKEYGKKMHEIKTNYATVIIKIGKAWIKEIMEEPDDTYANERQLYSGINQGTI